MYFNFKLSCTSGSVCASNFTPGLIGRVYCFSVASCLFTTDGTWDGIFFKGKMGDFLVTVGNGISKLLFMGNRG